jgi:hypothetical protein
VLIEDGIPPETVAALKKMCVRAEWACAAAFSASYRYAACCSVGVTMHGRSRASRALCSVRAVTLDVAAAAVCFVRRLGSVLCFLITF